MLVRLKVREVAEAKKISQRQLFFRSQVDLKTIQKFIEIQQASLSLSRHWENLHKRSTLMYHSFWRATRHCPEQLMLNDKSMGIDVTNAVFARIC